jgi:hypothetical protein
MLRRLVALTVALTVPALAACAKDGAEGVASAESSTVAPSTAPDGKQFAACLRERGIDVADPTPGGQVRLAGKDDRTRAALRACQRFAPPQEPQAEGSVDPAAARAYAACIRGKGFPDFPDPDARGPQIPKNLVHDQRFKTADRECAHHLNEAKGKT